MPDRFEQSTGGMGSASGPMLEKLADDFDIYVCAHPLQGTPAPAFVKQYEGVIVPFTEVKFGPMNIVIAQTEYLAAAVRMPRPDIIYAYDWSVYLASVEAARYFKVPLVVRMCLSPIMLSMEGYSFGLNLDNPAEKSIHNMFCEMEIRGMKFADRIVQVSETYTKMYDRVAPNFREKTRVILNGIDLAVWQKKDVTPFKFPGKNKLKAIYLGRFSEMKGILPLCAAKVPDGLDLIFIGDEARGDAVCIRAIHEKIKRERNVHLLGPIYGADKIAALRAADAIIVPSHHETFGNAAMEGLAAGTIVISSRVGGLADYLNDGNSIFCGTKPEIIELAFNKFIRMTEGEREMMRRSGIEQASTMTAEKAGNALRDALHEAIQAYPHKKIGCR